MEKEKEPSLWSGPCSKCEAINLAHNLFVPSNVVKWTIDDLNEGRSVEGGVEKLDDQVFCDVVGCLRDEVECFEQAVECFEERKDFSEEVYSYHYIPQAAKELEKFEG